MTISQTTRPLLRSAAQPMRALARRSRTEADWLRTRRGAADLAVFHEFRPPPYGGGNQFLLALVRELEGRGLSRRGQPALRRDAGLSLQLVQLRLRAPAAFRPRRCAHGAPRRRSDRRLSRLRRRDRPADCGRQSRACVRDHPAVAVQPGQAPGARARPDRSGRDSQRRRPGDLSSTCRRANPRTGGCA